MAFRCWCVCVLPYANERRTCHAVSHSLFVMIMLLGAAVLVFAVLVDVLPAVQLN